jgi:hypothetical protein
MQGDAEKDGNNTQVGDLLEELMRLFEDRE